MRRSETIKRYRKYRYDRKKPLPWYLTPRKIAAIDRAIAEAEAEAEFAATGEASNAREVLRSLREKYFR